MQRIEKYRKLCKIVQYGGMIIIIIAAMFLMYWFGFRGKEDSESSNSLSFLLGAVVVLFMFMTFVMLPMQNHLLKIVILESLSGLVSDVKFNKKKGFSKESFLKLNLVNQEFSQYICQDYYSFNYNDMFIESTTIKAADEIKVEKVKGNKKSKKEKKTIVHYFGRVYVIPYSSDVKFNVYGKKHPSVSRKKDMADKSYCHELPLKFKKHFENFEVFYKDEKPENIQPLLEKLLNLKLQAKGPVSLFVRKNNVVLCIDNSHYYKELEIKKPIDESIVREYRKDVSMVLSFINALSK